MSSKYRKIKTADELEKAIREIKAEQKATGKSIYNGTGRLLDSLKPSNLIFSLIPGNIWTDAGIGLVHGIRKIVTATKSRKKEAAIEENAG